MFNQWEQHGEPDITISGLFIWIIGRSHPDSKDYWDVNWLDTVIFYKSNLTRITLQGPYVRTAEFLNFSKELDALLTNGNNAYLKCLEPALELNISSNNNQDFFTLEIKITDINAYNEEQHTMLFNHFSLGEIMMLNNQIKRIVEKYPVMCDENE